MPIFEVTTPEGKKYKVNTPEGATQQDAIRYIATQQQQGIFNQPDTSQPKILKEGEGSDFARGLFTYFDQYGGITGGAKVLAGKATGNDDLIKSGMADMQESEAKVGARGVKATDEFTKAWDQGISTVLTEFVPFIAGQGIGMIGEAFVTSVAGAMVGSAVAPGAGTMGGALTGFVGKELVKKGIIETAKEMSEEQAQKYIRNETAKLIQSEAGKRAIKDIYKRAGSNIALTGMAGKFGAGEVTGRAVDEAIKDIEDPELQLQKIKELSTGKLATLSTAHALANFIGLKIGLGSLEKMAKPTQNALLNVVKSVGITGLKEAPVEFAQSIIERFGADLPLTDRAAIEEYINAAAAGFAMPIIPATIGGIRTTPRQSPTTSSPEGITVDPEPKPKGPEAESAGPEQTTERKGWEFDDEEIKRRDNIIQEQEKINLNQDEVDVDLNDADVRPKLLTGPKEETTETYDLPPIDQIERDIKEKQDVERLGELDDTPDRGSIQVPQSESTTSRKQLPPTKKPGEVVRSTVDSNTSDASPIDGREGAPLSALSLTPEEGFERIQVGTQDVVTGYDKDGVPLIQQEKLFVDRPIQGFVQETNRQLNLPLGPAGRQGRYMSEEMDLYNNAMIDYVNKRQYRSREGKIVSEYDNVGLPYAVTPEGIAESESIYTSILNTDGKAAADRYIQNKRQSDPIFNQTKIDTQSAAAQSESQAPIYATNNLEKAQAYLVDNNLSDYYINPEETFDGKTIAYSVRPKTLLSNTRPITVADFLIRDKGKNLNKTSNPLKFSAEPDVNTVREVLQNKLDTSQFNQLNANPKVFKTIAREFAKRSSDQDAASTPTGEIKARAARELEFDARSETLPGYQEFMKRMTLMGIKDLPSFMKTGAVFGSAQSPITGANNMLDVIEAAIGDYIFEEAADAQSKVKDFGTSANVSPADKARRKAFRDEFINSPIIQEFYLNRQGSRYNNIDEIKNDIKNYKNYFTTGTEYNSGREVINDIEAEENRMLAQVARDQKDKAAEKRVKNKIIEQVKKKSEKYKRGVKKAEVNLDDIVIDENIETAIDEILDLPAQINPFDEMAANSEDINADLAEMLDDRSEINRLIQQYQNDTVGLLTTLREELLRKARISEALDETGLASYRFQQAELITQILKIPGLDKVSIVNADPKTLQGYLDEFYDAAGRPRMKKGSTGFYTPINNVRTDVSKLNRVVKIKGAEFKDTIVIDDTLSAGRALRTLLHELAHVGTVNAINFDMLTDAEMRSLQSLFVKARRYALMQGRVKKTDTEVIYQDYGFTNTREFIAEAFSNPDFQKFLATVPSDNKLPSEVGFFRSLFDDFVSFVSRTLGLENIDNTVLKDTIQLSARAFNIGTVPTNLNKDRVRAWNRKADYRKKVDEIREIEQDEASGEITPARARYRKLVNKVKYPEYAVDPMSDEKPRERRNVEYKPFTIVKVPKAAVEDKPERTLKEIEDKATEMFEKEERTFGKRLKNTFSDFFKNGDKLLTDAIRNFANRSIDIKKLQDNLERSNLLLVGVDGFNNVFDQLTRAFGLSDNYMKAMQPAFDAYSKALGTYIDLQEQNGLNKARAKGRLEVMLIALHESERREIKFLLDVPLSTEKIIRRTNGSMTSPAQLRSDIMDQITTKVWKDSEQRKNDLQKYKDQLRKLANSETKISGKRTVDAVAGTSYFSDKKGGPTDITNSRYNVSNLSAAEAAIYKNQFENLKYTDPDLHESIIQLRKAMTELNKSTLNLNAEANYAGPQAMNVIEFYDWKNYVPLKRENFDAEETFYNPTGGRMSRELKKLESSFEGNQGNAGDIFAQTLADASKAAARAGRISYTQSIYNAVTQTVKYKDPVTGKEVEGKAIDGKVIGKYTYEQRYRNDPDLQKQIGEKNTIIHFLDDGGIAVIEIKDDKLLRAIRGSYEDTGPFIAGMNRVTGFIGQLHTRFNLAFATLNFVRDAITNIFYVSADLGLKDTGGYMQRIAQTITDGGMIKVAKVMNFYTRGRIKELEAYVKSESAKGNTLPASMYEYLQNGGMISYSQALSIETAYERLQENIERSKDGIVKSRRNVKDFFDIWMSTFELTTRAAAYQTYKQNYLSQNAAGLKANQVPANVEKAAIERAVVYAKRLSNFEERGLHGDMIGAWFMFFRPSAVGIVRAFESLSAALQRKDVAQSNLPDFIKGNPEALAEWSANFDKRRSGAMGMMAAGVGMGYAVWHMSALLAGDDEDNPTREDDPARWTRFARFDLSSLPGFKEGDVLQIPWGFGPGGFAAVGAQLAAYGGANKTSMGDTFANMLNITLDSFMPLPFSRMSIIEHPTKWFIDTIMPSIARPTIEYAMNTNAFGQNIYNPVQNRKYGAAYGGSDNVADLYKDISIFLAEATNGSIDWSPNTISFFANNYFDAVGRFAHDMYGLQLTLKGNKDFDAKRDLVLFDSFLSKYSTQAQRDYSEAVQEIDELNRKLTLFKDTNIRKYTEVLSEYPAGPVVIKQFNKMKADLDKLNKQANDIRRMPGLTAKERANLLEPVKNLQLMYKASIARMVELGLESDD